MLCLVNAGNLIERLWHGAPLRAQLPAGEEDFFAPVGPTLSKYDERRVVHRFYLRRRALMRYNDQLLGVLTCDISSSGVGLLSPVQLFPLDQPRLILSQEFELSLQAVRCRRQAKHRYYVGAEVNGASSEAALRDLMRAVQHGSAAAVLC